MKFVKSTSVEELQVIGRFEHLRKVLLADQFSAHLDKPLVSWALPADRRLPLALMGRKLGDLLATPFAELAATPGIGYQKICSFIKLLGRAANTNPADLPLDLPIDQEDGHSCLSPDQEDRHSCLSPDPHDGHTSSAGPRSGQSGPLHAASTNGFDPDAVSEVVWGQWRSSVLRHGLGPESLGRFAPSLMHMTRVIWRRSLADYAGMSLDEIRRMKTHGEKRVRAVLDVFHALYSLLAHVGPQEHFVLRIVPRQIDAVETWVAGQLQLPGIPPEEELLARFVEPLLAQLRIDAAPQIVSLAENRLGIHAPLTSVRQVARNMGLTRARVYQLLNEINDIMAVRWPSGRQQVYQLDAKFRVEAQRLEQPVCLEQFQAAIDLFYPRSRRGASGMLERIDGPHRLDGALDGDASLVDETGISAVASDQ
jgi:hypothetical protein